MTYEQLLAVLAPVGIPWTYHHWDKPPQPPYGVYLDGPYDPFHGDNINYFNARQIRLEVYSLVRDPVLDAKIQSALTAAEIPYEADFAYLQDQLLYESIFEIEV